MPTQPPGRRAAVLGRPIRHSLSPALHTAAYTALGLRGWTYDRVECGEDGLAGHVAGLGPEWVGLSLTMPLKRVALDVATEVSDAAAAIGAANTLLLDGAHRRAENTDAPGMVDALRAAGVVRPQRPVLLGAGGTAQAALAASTALTPAPVTVLVRDPRRATDLVATAGRLGVTVDVRPLDQASGVLAEADLVVSTVPRGAADHLAGTSWMPGVVVLDVVYDPWPTPLAAGAAAAGCQVVSGLELLLRQAAHQVRLMTGRPAPLQAMRSALATR